LRPLRIGVLGAGVVATAEYGVLPNMVHLVGKAEVTAIAAWRPGGTSSPRSRWPPRWRGICFAHLEPAQHHVDLVRRAVLVEHLADCLREGREPELSLAYARHALEILLKAMESARTGEALDLETTF
jgi:hypothetical protein